VIKFSIKVVEVLQQLVGTKSAKRKLKKLSGKERRKSKNEFESLQCGYKEMADYVAAKNIAATVRAAANRYII
jgi:SPX domain protein involved in polyphosphate accumulation